MVAAARPLNIVGFTGNLRRPSRTRALATSIYASEHDCTDGRIVSETLLHRIEVAVSDLATWLERNDNGKLSRMGS